MFTILTYLLFSRAILKYIVIPFVNCCLPHPHGKWHFVRISDITAISSNL